MKKTIRSLLAYVLAAMLLVQSVPIAFADGPTPSVTVEDDTCTVGSSVTVTVTGKNFENLGALPLEFYYDDDVLALDCVTVGSDFQTAYSVINTDTAGVALVNLAYEDELTVSDAALVYLDFTVADDAPAGDTEIAVAVGDARYADLTAMTVSSTSGTLAVTEKVATMPVFNLSASTSVMSLSKGDTVTLQVNNSDYHSLTGGKFRISFDDTLFQVKNAAFAKGVLRGEYLTDINDGVPGQVILSFVSDTATANYGLFSVEFEVIGNADATAALTYAVVEAYDANNAAYNTSSDTAQVTLIKLPEEVDYPNMFLYSTAFVVGEEAISTLILESSDVAAADFSIKFNPQCLKVIAVEDISTATDAGAHVMVDETTWTKGIINFTYLNVAGTVQDLPLLKITWEVLSGRSHATLTPSGNGVKDIHINDVALEYVEASVCVYTATTIAATCLEDGGKIGKCSCKNETILDVVPALGHDYQDTVTEPTYKTQGYTTHTCSRCGDSYVDSYVDPIPRNGMCGDGVSWDLGADGTLVISGAGVMSDYSMENPAPYVKYAEDIAKIVVEIGITQIGGYAFYNCYELSEIFFNGEPPVISTTAFFGVTADAFYLTTNYDAWSVDARQDYGGKLTWSVKCDGANHISRTGEGWESDDSGHWQACFCSFVLATGEHDYGDGIVCSICRHAANVMWCKPVENQPYTGKAVTPVVAVYHRDQQLTEKVDYTVSYKNNKTVYAPVDTAEELAAFEAALAAVDDPKAKTVMVGDQEVTIAKVPQIVISGKGNYGSTETVYFAITPVELNEEDFLIPALSAAYSGKNILPKPVVTWNETSKAIKWKTDYDVYLNYGESNELLIQSTEAKAAFIDAEQYNLTVVGKGNFSGSVVLTYDISVSTLMSKVKIGGWAASLPWSADGAVQTGLVLTDSSRKVDGQAYTLTEGVDYTVSYRDNKVAGTATAVFTGLDEYIGQVTKTFKITGAAISKVQVEGIPKSVMYTGEVITLDGYSLFDKTLGVFLTEGEDYTVSYDKNRSKGTATILFTGINGYTGTLKKTFKIDAYDILKDIENSIEVEENIVASYMKGGAKPAPVITFNGKELVAGVDYTLAYKNNTAVADADSAKAPMITISGKGNFVGKLTVNFSIEAKVLSEVDMLVDDKAYTPKATGLPTVTLTDTDGKKLAAGKDYDKLVSYTYTEDVTLENGVFRNAGDTVDKKDIIPVGTVIRVTVVGNGTTYTGEASTTYRIVPQSLAKATVKVANQQYTGKPIVPNKDDITVTVNKVKVDPENFEIVSCTNNVNKGSATLTIRGVGENYGGVKTVKFKIDAKTMFWFFW